jgi:hypothetical protein
VIVPALVFLFFGMLPFFTAGQENAGEKPEPPDTPFPGAAEDGFPADTPAAGMEAVPEWYLSNAAGMTLERFPSRLAALRNPYALSIESFTEAELPESLKPHYGKGFIIEGRTLYRDGRKERRQWIFRNGQGKAMLNAVFDESGEDAGDGAEAEAPPEPALPGTGGPSGGLAGFMELYDDKGFITAEYEFSRGDADTVISYFYRRDILVRSETREKARGGETASGGGKTEERHLFTDYYRYTRFGSLRAVERLYHERPDRVRLAFPRLIPGSAADAGFVNPGLSYGTAFFEDLMVHQGYRVLYTTDERGRITGETRQDEEGKTIGVLEIGWSGDRISSVSWKTGEEERLAEFEYNEAGDRIAERDYHGGILERTLLRQGDRDVEELYLNGEVALRAVWEDGRKVSEERVRR